MQSWISSRIIKDLPSFMSTFSDMMRREISDSASRDPSNRAFFLRIDLKIDMDVAYVFGFCELNRRIGLSDLSASRYDEGFVIRVVFSFPQFFRDLPLYTRCMSSYSLLQFLQGELVVKNQFFKGELVAENK